MKKRKINWEKIVGLILILIILYTICCVLDVNAHNNIYDSDYGKFSWWNLLFGGK